MAKTRPNSTPAPPPSDISPTSGSVLDTSLSHLKKSDSGVHTIYERAVLRAKEDQNLLNEGTRSLIIEELGFSASTHPTVIRLTEFAQALRTAANQDPVLRFLGVQLPSEVEVVLVFDDEPNAFVFAEEPEKIFVTTGLLRMDATREEIISVLAHEQGHLIYKAIIKQEQDRASDEVASRFGETIWRPLQEDNFIAYQRQAIDQLASRSEELWCDTYGSYPAMNSCGVNPLSTARLEAKFATSEGLLTENASTSGIFLELLRSHPLSSERIWLSQRIAQTLSYPTFLTEKNKSPPMQFEIPRDAAAFEFIEQLELKTGYISYALSNITGCGIPSRMTLKNDGLQDPQALIERHRIGFIASLPKISGSSHIDGWRLKQVENKKYTPEMHRKMIRFTASSEGNVLPSTINFGSVKFEVDDRGYLTLRAQRPTTATPDFEIIPALTNVRDVVTNLKGSIALGTRCVNPIIELIDKGTFKFFTFQFTTHTHDSLSVFDPAFVALIADITDNSSPSEIPIKEITLLHSILRIGTSRREKFKEELDGALEQVEDQSPFALKREVFALAFGDTCRLRQSEIGDLDVTISTSADKKDVLLILDQLIHLTTHPLATFLTPLGPIFTNIEIANLVTKIVATAVDLTESEKEEYFRKLAEMGCYPDAHSYVSEHIKSEYFPSLLNKDNPNVLSPMWFTKNYHQYLAVKNEVITIEGVVTNLFTTKHPTLTDALSALQSQPHLFDASTWKTIATHYVHTVADLDQLTDFLKTTFVQHPYQYSVWRERTLVESLCAVTKEVAPSILQTQGAEGFTRLKQLVKELPRCALRNPVVETLVHYALTDESSRPVAEDLLTLFELEPASSIAAHMKSEFRERGSKILGNAEDEIEKLATEKEFTADREYYNWKQYVPLSAFETSNRYAQYKIGEKFRYITRGDRETGVIAFRIYDNRYTTPQDFTKKYTIQNEFKREFPTIASISNHLPIYATATMLRYTLFSERRAELPNPTKPLSLKPSVIKAVETSGLSVMKAAMVPDPLTLDFSATSHLTSCKNALGYLTSVIERFQPIATPLRDRWILRLIKAAEEAKTGGDVPLFSHRDLRILQKKLYLPENQQEVGEIVAQRLIHYHRKAPHSGLTPIQSLRYLSKVMPYYSVERNSAVHELLKVVGGYDYDAACVAAALHWTPGLPNPIPGQKAVLGNSLIETQIALLDNFDDFEKVAAILYLNGTTIEKPFAVTYMECLFGGTFESLLEEQKSLSPGARLEILHKIFGGTKGVFVNEDRSALKLLADTIVQSLIDSSPIIAQHAAATSDLVADLLWRAKLPVSVRVELLSSFLEWGSNTKDSSRSDSQAVADLIARGFAALGAPGLRILQGVVIEPNAFSKEISSILRESQDSIPPGPAQTPFHLAEADGVRGIKLKGFRGGGTLGEIHAVASVHGTPYEGVVQKSVRPEVLRTVRALENPLKHLSRTLKNHGFNWGEALVDRVINSCAAEYRGMSEEAGRTGQKMADFLALATDTVPERRGYTIAIPVDESFEIIIPRVLDEVKRDASNYSFLMGDLGESFTTFSKIVREQGREGLEDTLQQFGISLSKLADLKGMMFIGLLLEKNLLLKDLHFGNTGVIPSSQNEKGKIGMLDFGGVIENFPESEKIWLLATVVSVVSDDRELQRDLLLLAALSSGETVGQLRERLPVLEDLLTQLNTARTNSSNTSPLATLQELLVTVYESWPLTQPVREFIESLRKVSREWGPHMTPEALERLGLVIMMAGVEATTLLRKSESYKRLGKLLGGTSFDERCDASSSEEDIEYFQELTTLPEDAKFYLKDDSDGSWNSYLIKGRYRLGDKQITLEGPSKSLQLFMTHALKKLEGFLEVEDEDGAIRAIHFKDLF